jgi:cell cycle arrest protein BUB3
MSTATTATTTVAITAAHGSELSNPPSDGIGGLRFAHHSDMLLVSSWDKGVRLYDTAKVGNAGGAAAAAVSGAVGDQLTYEYKHKGAVLDCAWNGDDSASFAGGLDKQLIM